MCLSPLAICHHIFRTSLPPPPLTQSYRIKILDFRDLYNFIKFSEPSKNRGSTGISDWLIFECPIHIHCSQLMLFRHYVARNNKNKVFVFFFLFMAFHIMNLQVFPILQREIWIASKESWLMYHHIALFITFCKVLWVFSED